MTQQVARSGPLAEYLGHYDDLIGDKRTGETFSAIVRGIINAGSLLALADDAPWDRGRFTNSLIEALYLPVDGEYRIEAQSYMDEMAGGYTLIVESLQPTIDPAALQGYMGTHYIPAFPAEVSIYYEEGRLLLDWWPDVWSLNPVSETEFALQPWGLPLVFRINEAGQVTGFDAWMWGGWFEAERLQE